MVSIVLILSCSVVLFAYWFRYSCLLILQTRAREAGVQSRYPAYVEEPGPDVVQGSLDEAHRELAGEYRMLRFMMAQASDLSVDPIERRMLVLDYQLMRIWFQLTRKVSEGQARGALDEMSTIIGFLSQAINGQQTGRARA